MLRFYTSDAQGNKTELKSIFSAVIDCDVLVPADSLKLEMKYSKSVFEEAARIIAEDGGKIVFSGGIDSITSEKRGGAEVISIRARSAAALLLDNEAEPMDINAPSEEFVFRRILFPFNITPADSEGKALDGRLKIHKGMSVWQALEGFCRQLYGSSPKITADGKAYFKGLPGGEAVSFGDEGVKFFSIAEKRSPYRLISRVKLKSFPDGGYISVIANTNPEAAAVSRERFVDVSTGSRSLATAMKMIENSNRNSYSAVLKCPGCLLKLLGRRAEIVSGKAYARGGLLVRGVRYHESGKGAFSTVTLEREWT